LNEEKRSRDDVPQEIADAIAAVEPPDLAWAERTAVLQSRLTMPPGSLGRLLDLGRQLAAIQRTTHPRGHPALVAVFAADHGVVANGVSAYPAEVTGQMVANYLGGGAAVNVLARRAGAVVRVVDLGVAALPPEVAGHEALYSRAIGPGTRDFLRGPAMTREEAFRAVRVGLDLADAWAGREGFRVVALGEMGIGNTAALTDTPPERVVGRGTGVDDVTYARKCRVVKSALERHRAAFVDVWDCLARLGGFEILGLAGLAIGSARARSLVVLDGLISSVAGLIAARLCPPVRGTFVASHVGPEPGHRVVLDALGLSPILDLGLRLGEGTGATLALPIIASAADILRDMATFDSAGISEAGGKPAAPRAESRLSPGRPLG
jgi:nicotinate-nucleotide--dimethylbenzimidazole phosphoribosyltransferase